MIALWTAGLCFALTLEEARTLAVDEALAVQQRQAQVQVASGDALAALSAELPQLSVFAGASVSSGPNPFGQVSATQAEVGAVASWALLDPSRWAASVAARRSLRGQRALLVWSEATARRDATIAFADALGAVRVLEVLAASEADAAQAAQAVSSLAEAGLRPAADRARAQAEAARLTARRVAAQGEVAATCAGLQSLLGLAIDGRCELTAVSTWEEPAQAAAEHPAWVAATEAYRAARAARSGQWLSRVPAVTATASASTGVGAAVIGGNTDDAIDLSGASLSAGVRAEVPLISSGGGVGELRRATGEREQAAVALATQERELQAGRIAAEARHRSARAALEASERAEAAAREALALADERYRQGLADVEAWVAARRARDEAAVAVVAAHVEVGRTLATVEAVRGVR